MTEYDLRFLGGVFPQPFEERFASSFIPEPNSGCWIWLGSPCGSNSYGRIRRNKKPIMAHRAAWELYNGVLPSGMLVLHRCDNPACVNPEHLFLGTTIDNSNDKVAKGRQARGASLSHPRARGERNGNSRLTRDSAGAIRSDPRPQRVIAAAFGISQCTVWAIKSGRTWND